MKKTIYKLSLASVLGLGVLTNAQVLNNSMGVNTDSPKATLDVVTKSGATNSLRVENTSGNETFTFTNAGQLGIGNTTPEYGLDVIGNNAKNSSVRLTRYTTGILGPQLFLSDAKGTLENPQAIENGNYIGRLQFQGYDGKKFQDLSFIMSRVEGELQEGKTIPSSIMFYTSNYDTPEIGRSESMIITPEGKVGIGVEHPAERLEVKGSIKSSALAGVGTRNVVADANGKLMVEETQGLLANKMTTEERNAISNPEEGLMVYNTDLKCLQIYSRKLWSCTDGSHKSFFYKGKEYSEDNGYVFDRNFGDGEHDFIYKTINKSNQFLQIFLNNNLGADYANIHKDVFNPDLTSTGEKDYHAYGSLFEWSRKADGHELINWTGAREGTPKYGTTDQLASSWIDAGTNKFITLGQSGSQYPYMFTNLSKAGSLPLVETIHDRERIYQTPLWLPDGSNNPCPKGFSPIADYEIDPGPFQGMPTRLNNGDISFTAPYANYRTWTTFLRDNTPLIIFVGKAKLKENLAALPIRCYKAKL